MKTSRSAWRLFPLWMALSMLAAFAVNGVMVYDALHTFPGAAGPDGFDLSNAYSQVLAAQAKQAALGWQVSARADAERRAHVVVLGPDGAALPDISVQAVAERLVGPKQPTVLQLAADGTGGFASAAPLPRGQWDIAVTVVRGAQQMRATERVVVQ